VITKPPHIPTVACSIAHKFLISPSLLCIFFCLLQGPGYESRKLVGSLGAKNRFFDFDKLAEVTRVVTANLNKIIDVNYYPTETARRSNMRHRPIGLGVQVGVQMAR
jgi:hypothetical protein